MREINTISSALFDKIRSRFDAINLGDEDTKVTTNPGDARFFNFDYVSRSGCNYGNVTVSLIGEAQLKVYFGQNISQDMTEDDLDEWYSFLRSLRMFAKRNLLGFDVRDINKSNLQLKDVAQQSNVSSGEVSESKFFNSKLINEFEQFVEHIAVTESIYAMPNSDEKIKDLNMLLSTTFNVGIDGQDAVGALKGIIGDDSLNAAIYQLSQSQGPDADARFLIKSWVQDNKPALMSKLKFGKNNSQEADTNIVPQVSPPRDGVEYAAPGTDGSPYNESIDPIYALKNLAGLNNKRPI